MNDGFKMSLTLLGRGRSRFVPYLPAAIFLFVAAGAAAQDIVATPAERQAIEAQVSLFRLESDALRAAAGFARDPGTEDCVLQGAVSAVTYSCPAPTDSRERVKAAFLARGWVPASIPRRDPWYALDAFSKDVTLAYFVCAPGRKTCLLELRQEN